MFERVLAWHVTCHRYFVRLIDPLADTSGDSKEQVATEILSYFLKNPGAADSLTGIARWRLLEELVQRSVEATEAALDLLIAQGYVVEVTHASSDRIFQLNSERLKEAESYLRKERERKASS
jgi:hypothetical protein